MLRVSAPTRPATRQSPVATLVQSVVGTQQDQQSPIFHVIFQSIQLYISKLQVIMASIVNVSWMCPCRRNSGIKLAFFVSISRHQKQPVQIRDSHRHTLSCDHNTSPAVSRAPRTHCSSCIVLSQFSKFPSKSIKNTNTQWYWRATSDRKAVPDSKQYGPVVYSNNCIGIFISLQFYVHNSKPHRLWLSSVKLVWVVSDAFLLASDSCLVNMGSA